MKYFSAIVSIILFIASGFSAYFGNYDRAIYEVLLGYILSKNLDKNKN